jgi:hypothetical protein
MTLKQRPNVRRNGRATEAAGRAAEVMEDHRDARRFSDRNNDAGRRDLLPAFLFHRR